MQLLYAPIILAFIFVVCAFVLILRESREKSPMLDVPWDPAVVRLIDDLVRLRIENHAVEPTASTRKPRMLEESQEPGAPWNQPNNPRFPELREMRKLESIAR